MLASPPSLAKPVCAQACRGSASSAHTHPSRSFRRGHLMVRAAIVGLGRWGRSLVASVQGKSSDIRFVAAHTRTRVIAEDFCRDQGLPLADTYEQVLADPQVDAVVLATPHTLDRKRV